MLRKSNCLTLGACAAALLIMASSASAQNVLEQSKVTRLLNDSVNYGQCMALLVPGPESLAIDCEVNWVTFSCDGTFSSKSLAQQKLSSAQLAYVTQGDVRVVLDPTKKHNGYCFVERIDNI